MEFWDWPNEFHENDLRKALIRNMKDFILELEKIFTFIDEEYKAWRTLILQAIFENFMVFVVIAVIIFTILTGR